MKSTAAPEIPFRLSVFAAFASLVSVQIGAAFAKTVFPLVGPDGVAALRVGIAALLLGAIFRPWRLEMERRRWTDLLLYGAMMGGMNFLIYRAFFYIPVGIAVSGEVLGPLVVALIASRRRIDLLWIACAILGVALLPFGDLSFGRLSVGLDPAGVAYTLGAAFCWAIYVLVGGKVASLGSRGVAVGTGVAALFIVPVGVAQAGAALIELHVLSWGLVVAVLSSILPYLLDIYALAHLPRRVFSVLMSASPAVSALAGLAVLDERLSLLQWAGIAAITVACIGTTMGSGKGEPGA